MSSFPESVSLRKYISYLPSQENIDCCTANSALLASEILLTTTGIKKNFSRLYVYYMSRKIQDRKGKDGSSFRYTFEALKTYGAASDNIWPFHDTMIDIGPGLSVIENGVQNKLQSYQQIQINEFKEFLNKNIPIIIGMFVSKEFLSLRGNLEDQNYTSSDNHFMGHAMTCIGYDDNLNNGSWIMANSFGPRWGYQGYAAIPYSCNKDIAESFIITEFAGITAGKKISEN